jgi:hypothetical protein
VCNHDNQLHGQGHACAQSRESTTERSSVNNQYWETYAVSVCVAGLFAVNNGVYIPEVAAYCVR